MHAALSVRAWHPLCPFPHRALLDGPDPRIFSCAAAGDVAGLRQLFEEASCQMGGARGFAPTAVQLGMPSSHGEGPPGNRMFIPTAALHLPVETPKQEPDHDTDVFNGEGMAPLHLAAKGGHMGAVAFLLQRKSFVDMQDFDVSWEVWRWFGKWQAHFGRQGCAVAEMLGLDVSAATYVIPTHVTSTRLNQLLPALRTEAVRFLVCVPTCSQQASLALLPAGQQRTAPRCAREPQGRGAAAAQVGVRQRCKWLCLFLL